MGTFYLVDYENVGSGGVAKCSGLDKADQLHIFYTENSKNINLDIVDDHGDAVLETHKVPTGSQSADMHIVSFMGYLLGKYEKSQIKIVIVSKDKDYDNLIKFWSGKADISRKQKIDVSAPKKAQPAKKETESKVQAKNTKIASKTTENTTTKVVVKKATKSELKTQFNTPETMAQAKNTKIASKTTENTTTKVVVKKPTKSELKTQLNVEAQRVLSHAGYSQNEVNYIAKLVCKHFGEKNLKQEIHNDLRSDLGEYAYQEAYNCLKPILKKYDK